MATIKSIQTPIFGKNTTHIGVRTTYPRGLHLAAVKASRKKGTSVSQVADMFNVHKSTVCAWRRAAKVQGPVPAGLARHQAAAAAIKAFNTPILLDNNGQQVLTAANATHLKFRGKTYKL
jgi:transposase-like protein